MKRGISILMAAVLFVLCLAGCAKLISTEHKTVEVVITDTYYRRSYTRPVRVGNTTTIRRRSAVYRVTVKYNGTEYTINDRDTYNRYKDREGETVKGILEIHTYDDGTVKYNIIELE